MAPPGTAGLLQGGERASRGTHTPEFLVQLQAPLPRSTMIRTSRTESLLKGWFLGTSLWADSCVSYRLPTIQKPAMAQNPEQAHRRLGG